jgi:hypothetical protein
MDEERDTLMRSSPPSPAVTKRRYSAPRVTDAGSLRDLAFGGAASNVSDSGTNMMMPP